MKKLLLILLVLFTSLSAKSDCDWSGITFKQISQQGNAFYFETNMHFDSCWDYYFTVYDYQRKVEDTMDDWGGWFGVQFTAKGKYQARMIAFNRCKGCDTTFYVDIDITIFGDVKGTYKISPKSCKYYSFEMTNMKDSCIEYYWNIWKADDWINQMTDGYWKELSDSALYFGYSWDEELIEYYNLESERVFNYEFKDSGRYILIAQFYNKCTGLDTFMFSRLSVCMGDTNTTSSVKTIVKNADLRVIGYYDMMGRQVDYMRPNEVYIVLYSNGHRRKIMQIQN